MTKKNVRRTVTFLTGSIIVFYCVADIFCAGMFCLTDLPELMSWALATLVCIAIMAGMTLYLHKIDSVPEITRYVPTSCYMKHLHRPPPCGGADYAAADASERVLHGTDDTRERELSDGRRTALQT